jgi:hypothetical protein
LFEEKDWSDLKQDNFQFVHKSKTMAERMAWDFVKEHKTFELVTLVPTLMVGPTLISRRQTVSSVFLTRMIKN